jgi:hypothetical protein
LLPLWVLTLLALLIKIELDSKADGPKILMSLKKFFLETNQSSLRLQQKLCFLKIPKWRDSANLTLKIKTCSLITTLLLMLEWASSAKRQTYWVNSKRINLKTRTQITHISNLTLSQIHKNTEAEVSDIQTATAVCNICDWSLF